MHSFKAGLSYFVLALVWFVGMTVHAQTIPTYSNTATLTFNGQAVINALLLDVNGDGYTDVVGCFANANGTQELVVWEQTPSNTYPTSIDVGSVTSCASASVGDANGDNIPDIILPHGKAFLGSGLGTFTAGTVTDDEDACSEPIAPQVIYEGAAVETGCGILYNLNGTPQTSMWTTSNGNSSGSGTYTLGTSGPDLEGKGYPSIIESEGAGAIWNIHQLRPAGDTWTLPPQNLPNSTYAFPGVVSPVGVHRGYGCVPVDIVQGSSYGCVSMNVPGTQLDASQSVSSKTYALQYGSSASGTQSLGAAWSFPFSTATKFGNVGVYPWDLKNGANDLGVLIDNGSIYAAVHTGIATYEAPVLMASFPIGSYMFDAQPSSPCTSNFFLTSDATGGTGATTPTFGTNIHVYTPGGSGCAQPVTTALTCTPPTTYIGKTVTCVALLTASSGVPSCDVTFDSDGVSVGQANTVNGSATLTGILLPLGTHEMTSSCPATGGFAASSAGPVPVTITKIPTGITLVTSPNPSIVTNTVNAQMQVTAADGSTPTGSVSLVADGNNTLGTPLLANGAAGLAFNGLSVGAHSLTAAYPGTATYDSSSVTETQTVNQIPTNTVVTASPASSTYLQCVTFTATVTATEGSPTGSVVFTALAGSSSTTIGTGTLNGAGVTTVSSCSLSPASYTVKAAYGGTTNFVPSSGTTTETIANLRVVVVPPSGPTSPATPPYNPGTPISIPVTGFPTPPGGAAPTQPISIFGGSTGTTPIGTVPPGGGTIVFTPIGPGTYPISSCYPGDANYADTCPPSSPIGSPVTISVTAPTALVAVANPNPATFGQSATVTATVSSSYGTPTGSVGCVADSSNSLGSAVVNGSGAATLNAGLLAVGAHTIACSFTPTGLFDASTGGTALTVNKAMPTVAVSFSPEPSYPGDAVTITATVSGISAALPSGTVTFTVDGTNAGTATLASGVASITMQFASVGSHTAVATYSGDGDYLGATGSGSHAVVKLPTTTTVSATPDPAIGGQQSITLMAVTIFPDLPFASPSQRFPLTGTVQFYDNGVLLGTAPMNGSTEEAQLALTSLAVGTHSLTATYSGDVNYQPSSSVSGAFVETMLAPISGLVVDGNTDAAASASVTYTAQVVNPLGVPQTSGTVTWTANGAIIGTSQVVAGATTLTTSYSTPGNYSVVASYVGEQQPGSITFSQNVLSTGTDGSAPFVISSPSTVTMATDGTSEVSLTVSSEGVSSPIALTCSGAPAGYTCNLSPSTLVLTQGETAPTVSVTITHNDTATQAQERTSSEIAFAGVGLGLFGLLGLRRSRKTVGLLLCIVGLTLSGMGLTGCGIEKQYASYAPQSYSVTVTAAVDTYKESVVVSVKR